MTDTEAVNEWEEKYRPRKGDRLFVSFGDPGTQALLYDWGHSFSLYAEGYKKAADIIVQRIQETGWDQDYLVFPVCFLYRHYLELQLKHLIHLGRQLVEGRSGFPQGHNIKKLWAECRPLLEKAFPGTEKEYLDPVEDSINEFDSIDRSSEEFRYPQDRNGKRTLPRLKHLNLANLRKVMTRLSGPLDGSACGLYEALQIKWEMESECVDEGYF